MENLVSPTIEVSLFGKTYTIGYPTVGQKLEIESLKLLYTNGTYGDLARSNHITGNKLLDMADAFSYFSSLIPDLKDVLSVKQFLSLSLQAEIEIKGAYDKYHTFYKEYEDNVLKSFLKK